MLVSVDAARFAAAVYDVPDQAAWRVRIGGRYLLASGDVVPGSGSIDLLEAHSVMVQEQPALADVRLVIVGREAPEVDPAYSADFRERAALLGSEPRLLGQVADDDLPALVAGAAAFVHLPTRDERYVAALEALAAGVPVVARDLPELRDVLGDVVAYGDTVLSIADALVDVLTDPPDPEAGIALAASYAPPSARPVLVDRVVEEQPDRSDRREE